MTGPLRFRVEAESPAGSGFTPCSRREACARQGLEVAKQWDEARIDSRPIMSTRPA